MRKLKKLREKEKFEMWEKHLKNEWNKIKFEKLFSEFFMREIDQIAF